MENVKYTNNTGISLPMAVWLLSDDYDYSDDPNLISVTTLLKPTRQIVLGRVYKDNLKEIEASNLIATSMGSALHDSIEKAWSKRDIVVKILTSLGYKNPETIPDAITFEKRSEKEIDGYKVSGKFDMAFMGIVCDVKSTSVWSYIYASKDDDYIKQMSIYRWLNPDLITNDHGYIEFIFTDWSPKQAKIDKSYPQSRLATKKLKLMSLDETEAWVKSKLAEVKKYESMDIDKLLKCSNEELWCDKDKWKYYKSGDATKRATKVCDTEDEAVALMRKNGTGKVVEFRGTAKRCGYCNYTNVCTQYTELQLAGRL